MVTFENSGKWKISYVNNFLSAGWIRDSRDTSSMFDFGMRYKVMNEIDLLREVKRLIIGRKEIYCVLLWNEIQGSF